MRGNKTPAEVWRLAVSEWRILAEACACLVAARVAVWFVPFRRLASGLGDKMSVSPSEDIETHRATSDSIGWAVRALGRRLPGMRQCLVQAIAVTWMLKRRQIPSTLYFGLAKDEGGELEAHAWVRSGTRVLTGAKGRHKFKVVATFAESRLNAGADCAMPR